MYLQYIVSVHISGDIPNTYVGVLLSTQIDILPSCPYEKIC